MKEGGDPGVMKEAPLYLPEDAAQILGDQSDNAGIGTPSGGLPDRE